MNDGADPARGVPPWCPDAPPRVPHTAPTDLRATLTAFAGHFVVVAFRERFVHEALKKPRRLHARVCHELPAWLAPPCGAGDAGFQAAQACWSLVRPGVWVAISWADARERLSAGGGGHLVIAAGGERFHAESEGFPPRVFAGRR